jgi:hypothetical protein
MSVTKLLERLQGVKPRQAGRWLARCPAHDDRNPSLSIEEKSDGKILLYCFAGCGAAAVIDAVGLRYWELFPKREKNETYPLYPGRQPTLRINPYLALEGISYEAMVVLLIAEDLAKLNTEFAKRLALAVSRIGGALIAIGKSK